MYLYQNFLVRSFDSVLNKYSVVLLNARAEHNLKLIVL